jgi:hypothetical protein
MAKRKTAVRVGMPKAWTSGVGGHHRHEGTRAFEQIVGQPELGGGLRGVHRSLLSSTSMLLFELHMYYYKIYRGNSNKQYQ